MIDGSVIPLQGKPRDNPFAYYCRKGFYAVRACLMVCRYNLIIIQVIIQATCDINGVFTSYDFGWPGSVQDSCMLKESHLWHHKEQYFNTHKYILVDKGVCPNEHSLY